MKNKSSETLVLEQHPSLNFFLQMEHSCKELTATNLISICPDWIILATNTFEATIKVPEKMKQNETSNSQGFNCF